MKAESKDPLFEIIEGCVKGDSKCQQIVYQKFYGKMLGACMRYSKDREEARDILQDGFLKVFNNIQRDEPGKASLYTWIRTIVIHTCLDFIRSKQRIPEAVLLAALPEEAFEAEVIQKLKAADLLLQESRGQTQLSPDDRTALDAMLRSSDDSAAEVFWNRSGGSAIVSRVTARSGLGSTTSPYNGGCFKALDTTGHPAQGAWRGPTPGRSRPHGNP